MTRVREWKPGDVGTSQYGRVFNTHRGWVFDDDSGYTSTNKISGFRPLVVVDPEAEIPDTVLDAFKDAWREADQNGSVGNRVRAGLAAALREFANPVVKPEEPTGLAAVVEDADGDRWVRSRIARGGLLHAHWENSRTCAHRAYSDIDAVKVLSDGIPA